MHISSLAMETEGGAEPSAPKTGGRLHSCLGQMDSQAFKRQVPQVQFLFCLF